MSSMTSLTLPQPQWTHAPKLRLVPRKDDAPASTVDREGLEATGFGAGLAIDAAADDRSPVLVAGCDPAAGLLAAEYARQTGRRMIVLRRSSGRALRLLEQPRVVEAGWRVWMLCSQSR